MNEQCTRKPAGPVGEGYVMEIARARTALDNVVTLTVHVRGLWRGGAGLTLSADVADMVAESCQAQLNPYFREMRVITRAHLDVIARLAGFKWTETQTQWQPRGRLEERRRS